MIYKKSDYIKPLETCSKKIKKGHQISEYYMMLAISRMSNTFTRGELDFAIKQMMVQENLDSLVTKGLLDVVWSEEKQAVVYYAKDNIKII